MNEKKSCVYGGLQYSHGSTSCQEGKQYVCDDGEWIPNGADCESIIDLEAQPGQNFVCLFLDVQPNKTTVYNKCKVCTTLVYRSGVTGETKELEIPGNSSKDLPAGYFTFLFEKTCAATQVNNQLVSLSDHDTWLDKKSCSGIIGQYPRFNTTEWEPDTVGCTINSIPYRKCIEMHPAPITYPKQVATCTFILPINHNFTELTCIVGIAEDKKVPDASGNFVATVYLDDFNKFRTRLFGKSNSNTSHTFVTLDIKNVSKITFEIDSYDGVQNDQACWADVELK